MGNFSGVTSYRLHYFSLLTIFRRMKLLLYGINRVSGNYLIPDAHWSLAQFEHLRICAKEKRPNWFCYVSLAYSATDKCSCSRTCINFLTKGG
jgi:hypothetical protein